MALTSDITIDVSKFQDSAILPATAAFNERLMDNTAKGPKWFEVGARKFREMIHAGETSIPKPVFLEAAGTFQIPSRDAGRTIPCRVLKPSARIIKGVYMHLHLGGWMLSDETSQDVMLQRIANSTGLVCVSVGYRLAPENPFPAGPEDCFDAAGYLIEHSKATFGADFAFIGGESAGAHLSILTAIHLRHSPEYSSFNLKGLLLHFGVYDLSGLPQYYNFSPSRPLLIDLETIQPQLAAFCPGVSSHQLKDPAISPLYQRLSGLDLPPALFTCGTQDMLLDDTVFMSVKWMMSGSEAVVRIYPGASHAYLGFPDIYPPTKQVFQDIETFVGGKHD
jgi:acetyl esterase/lipase